MFLDDRSAFIRTIKEFGENKLGLKFGGSFETMADSEFSCNWVYACKPESLRSIFKHPFEFYGNEAEALKRAEMLKHEGYDTYFYHAEAHGGKACPVTKDLLSSPRARQCYVVLHEAWHVTSRLDKHNFSYPFEESTGRVIGLFGGIELAKELGDKKLLQECIDQEAAWSLFAEFVNESHEQIAAAIENGVSPEKIHDMKKDMNQKAALVKDSMPDSWEKTELDKEINNAFIMRYYSYTVHYKLAKKIYLEEHSVKSVMKKYVSQAKSLGMVRA